MAWPELADNVLTGAMDGEKDAAGKSAGDFFRRSFEGLRMGTEPDFENAVAADPLMDTAGDGFHFRELGHRSIIRGSKAAGQRVGKSALCAEIAAVLGDDCGSHT